MKIYELGEFGLIKRIARHGKRRKDTVLGIGDDAAVLQGRKTYQLITTDKRPGAAT